MRRIGIITNDQHGLFQRLVIDGAETSAAEHQVSLVIDSTLDADSKRLTLDDADGFLVVANAATREFLEAARRANTPVTLISHRVPPSPAVVFDNRQGVLELVRHLVMDCRRSQLIFVRGIPDQYDAQQREAAFQEALLRFRVPAENAAYLDGEFNAETAVRALRAHIETGKPFNGIVASDYIMARALVECLRELDYGVPEKVAVVGFGDGPEAREAGLTTVAADVEELGRRAARQLIHQMNGATIKGVTTLSVRLIQRDTSYIHLPVKRQKGKELIRKS